MSLPRKKLEERFLRYADSKKEFKRAYLLWCFNRFRDNLFKSKKDMLSIRKKKIQYLIYKIHLKSKQLSNLKKDALKEKLRHQKLPVNGNKNILVDRLIFTNKQTQKCGRALNGQNEDKMLDKLVISLTQNRGHEILREFSRVTGVKEEVVEVEKAGGRGKHYDLVFVLGGGKRVQVEVKSTECDKLNEVWAPWSEGVQAINGPGQRFELGRKYADKWYEVNVKSGRVNSTFGLKTVPPNREEWLKNLAFKQGKPSDKWGAELYDKSKQGGVDYNKMKVMKADFTKKMIEMLGKRPEILINTIPEAQKILNETFGQKHAWLRIASREFKWETGIPIPKLREIKLKPTTKTGKISEDLYVDLLFDNFEPMVGICRWGYGNGVANIRLDFK